MLGSIQSLLLEQGNLFLDCKCKHNKNKMTKNMSVTVVYGIARNYIHKVNLFAVSVL